MRLTAKSAYAIKALRDLVAHSCGRPISVRDISRRAGISSTFLCQIFNRIRKKGLVKSVRGANGGYLLARHPGTIKISDIISALEEPLYFSKRFELNNQAIKMVWRSLQQKISEVLSNTTLADVCRK